MYHLDINMIVGNPQICLLTKIIPDVSFLWHRRLVHLNLRYMNDLVSGEMVWGLPILKFENDHLCTACECGNQSKKGHYVLLEKSISKPLELLHINLCGLYAVERLHHKNYILMKGVFCFWRLHEIHLGFLFKMEIENNFRAHQFYKKDWCSEKSTHWENSKWQLIWVHQCYNWKVSKWRRHQTQLFCSLHSITKWCR